MPTLYYIPGSAAMAPHAAYLEAGVEPELVRVRREDGVTVEPADYLAINPHGVVPALADGDLRLYESAAIVLHVADRFPQAALLPPSGSDDRSTAVRWLVHLTNTVQPQIVATFAPHRVVGEAGDEFKAAVKEGAKSVLARQYDWIDGELAGRQYLLGDTFSAPDLYLFMLTRWGRNLAPKAWDRPNIGAHYARVGERPSVRRMMELQGLEQYPAD